VPSTYAAQIANLQAILATGHTPTLTELRALANDIPIESVSNNSIFYSGSLAADGEAAVKASSFATLLAEANPSAVNLLDKTGRASFLQNKVFVDAVETWFQSAGNASPLGSQARARAIASAADSYLNDLNSGFWVKASQDFAQSATGNYGDTCNNPYTNTT
jgi:hypothetical protein